MRVLLWTYGSRGDVEPVAALAVRLRETGARIRVCAPPEKDFENLLAGADVPLVPVGQPARSLATGSPTELMANQFDADTTRAAARDCDVVVVTGMMPAAAGACSVAEKLGIPSVYAVFSPGTLPSPLHPPMDYPGRPFAPETTADRMRTVYALFGAALNDHRASLRLPLVADVRDYVRSHVLGERVWLATDPVLDPWQDLPEFDVVQTGAWILPDERPLSSAVAEFLDVGAAPVYVGFGSMPVDESTVRAAVNAVRKQGRRVIVARGWAGLGPVDDAGDCLYIDEVNQQELFTRVAAVVHHGGAGTTATAARAGAPQVVVPQAADQPYWASRVVALGIGAALADSTPNADDLAAALTIALAPDTRSRAAEVAGAVRTDGAATAANLLLTSID